jgi:hypothetical protein
LGFSYLSDRDSLLFAPNQPQITIFLPPLPM